MNVAPNQLAYVYFTSGSTGEPKGAMCEHAGMLNHMLAKIDDLEIGNDGVVAQIAPQCFDISLWQMLTAHWSAGARFSLTKKRFSTFSGSSTKLSKAQSQLFRSCLPTLKSF